MLIDWFTVGAQALNFLILMWLLKRYLYKPMLRAIDARERRIADELADAKAKKVEAQSECDEFRRKNADFDQQRAELLSLATEDAKVERQRLLDAARKDSGFTGPASREFAKRTTQPWSGDFHPNSKRSFCDRSEDAGGSRRSRSRRANGRCVRRASTQASGAEKQALISATRTSAGPALLRSAFDLPPRQRLVLDAARVKIRSGLKLNFGSRPRLTSSVASNSL